MFSPTFSRLKFRHNNILENGGFVNMSHGAFLVGKGCRFG